jgi:transcriptional regulator
MYIPNAYREENLETLVAFMRANSFVTLVSVLDGVPHASHIPLVVHVDGGVVTLTGHLARQNPHCQALGAGESLAIFTGPHAYVSPSLYAARESVPTWNYIAVHASGPLRTVTPDDSAQLRSMVERMIDTYEPGYHAQWSELSDKFRSGMLKGIVGFEMAVARLEGKYKLSQNRSVEDQQRVALSLSASDDPVVAETGAEMERRLPQSS